MEQKKSSERWERLLAELLDGQLSDQQAEELRALVAKDVVALEFYVRHVLTHAMLQWENAGLDTPAVLPAGHAPAPPNPPPVVPSADSVGAGGLFVPAPTTAPISDDASEPTTAFYKPFLTLKPWLLLIGFGVFLSTLFIGGNAWRQHRGPDLIGQQPLPANPVDAGGPAAGRSALGPAVARLTLADNNRWQEGTVQLAAGDRVEVNQTLKLASGVVEITFDIGVRIVLQGPANFQIDSEKSVRLRSGKLTAEILKPEARGFAVQTPNGKVVDLGTEFGVEVTPAQDIQVHVFKGEVVVQPTDGEGTRPAQHLTGNKGLRLAANSSIPVLSADTGESFIRSIKDARRDQHVIAYWRFEDRPLGVLLPDTRGNSRPVCATMDSSFNGNDLFTGITVNRPVFSADVPAGVVPQTGHPNRGCLDTSQPTTEIHRLNVYTHSEFSHAAPLDIQRIAPAQWTIEASVKAAKLSGIAQGFLGRDANFTYAQERGPARLTFQINAHDRFAIGFYDGSDRYHKAVAEEPRVEAGKWYHLAASSDGRVLRLYVDALDGRGYVQRATQKLPTTGSTALGKGEDEAEWSLGRAGNAGDREDWLRFWGWLDEIRISDLARDPAEFLFAPAQEQKDKQQEAEPK